MEILMAFGLILAGFVSFDVLASRFGADSRERIGDDHAWRPARGWL